MKEKNDKVPADPKRQALRASLTAARDYLPDRARREARLVDRVSRWLATVSVRRLAFYFPIRSEPDVSAVIKHWLAGDPARVAALPLISGDLLEFVRWVPGTPMQVGQYDIPVPVSSERVKPQLVMIPCVGIDNARFRLGYGGGYYDRTLAAIDPRPVTVGIAFECSHVASIGPQPHDVRLDLAITDDNAW
jgi:5-formyltetrahydrofolate cyclo-ligase